MTSNDDGATKPRATTRKTAARGATRSRTTASKAKKAQSKQPGTAVDVRNRGGRPRKYDYESARALYVEGLPGADKPDERRWVALSEIAAQTGIPEARLKEQSAKYRWVEQRNNYQVQAAAARRQARIKKLAKESTDFDEASFRTAKLGASLVSARLAEIAGGIEERRKRKELVQRMVERGEDLTMASLSMDDIPTLDARELETLGRAAKTWHDLAHSALGDDVQRIELTGKDGGPVETTVNVTTQLLRDDPARLQAFLRSAQRAGLPAMLGIEDDDDPDVVEGEVVEETQPEDKEEQTSPETVDPEDDWLADSTEPFNEEDW